MKLFRATVSMERDCEICLSDILIIANTDTEATELLEDKLKEDGWINYDILIIKEVEQKEKVLGVLLSM